MFKIFVKTTDGLEFLAFTWARDAESGIARARVEAKEVGYSVERIWSEEVGCT